MTPKPEHIFDRDDDWQALVSFVADPGPQATLGVVSGRRRQGKTYLLSALADATGGFYFEAAEATETETLRMFGAALARHWTHPRRMPSAPGRTRWRPCSPSAATARYRS